jgi:large subunit ribosomal protein L13e
MPKHNNVIANIHHRKDWQRQTKMFLNQAAQKQARRLKRKAKAAAIAPRPVSGLLRPIVHCQTAKYKSRVRAGRGFSLAELKEAGINKKTAMTIGIAVDVRRTNKSVESLQANVARLKEFKSKLILFPTKCMKKPKNGDSTEEEVKSATQLTGALMPITNVAAPVETMAITEDMKSFSAYKEIRIARADHRLIGILASNAWKKAKAAK